MVVVKMTVVVALDCDEMDSNEIQMAGLFMFQLKEKKNEYIKKKKR